MVCRFSASVLLSTNGAGCGSAVGNRDSDSVDLSDAHHLHEWRPSSFPDGHGTGGIAFVLDRDRRRSPLEIMRRVPNQPAAPNAGFPSRLAIKHHWSGVGEPGRWAP